jgi:hypothetical protein
MKEMKADTEIGIPGLEKNFISLVSKENPGYIQNFKQRQKIIMRNEMQDIRYIFFSVFVTLERSSYLTGNIFCAQLRTCWENAQRYPSSLFRASKKVTREWTPPAPFDFPHLVGVVASLHEICTSLSHSRLISQHCVAIKDDALVNSQTHTQH